MGQGGVKVVAISRRNKPNTVIKTLGVIKDVLAAPFMLLFGFKVPIVITSTFTLVVGDLFMATLPWLFSWLIVLNVIAAGLDIHYLWTQRNNQIDKENGTYKNRLFLFATFTMGLFVGTAFFISSMLTGILPLELIAKTFLTIAFGCLFGNAGYNMWQTAPKVNNPRTLGKSILFLLNSAFNLATLVLLLWVPGVNATLVTAFALTCFALSIADIVERRFMDSETHAPLATATTPGNKIKADRVTTTRIGAVITVQPSTKGNQQQHDAAPPPRGTDSHIAQI